ncbi:hypothetical protein M2M59_08345 [Rummeliibacillus sp. G93]|uniref:Uncharacterized protein n=1 Tax=Rummeliibacillus stabekisii TaxID=241244 RepID=A0A143HBE5_9BACL|nr:MULTISPECIES: hypothetical protein [Rummeliibacillus]AMW99063.1 hypothetical protein ATY39_06085 [Rummeliibacillus stabekisii]MBB5169227.1 hypothetical protein [Rummeliibacillus stabekisii]MCM3316498.1 hypothetical protein [Rummeliibacillus stabekisii]UQW96030.1 hypothetical protein M2M59_08345 [Rummeliibacillus sp. G93]GEL03488.1 hypothetical protein RST01_01150 [Rummeliibacillus stabekisii]
MASEKQNNQQEDESLVDEGVTIGQPESETGPNPPERQPKAIRTIGFVVLGIVLIVLGYTLIYHLMY